MCGCPHEFLPEPSLHFFVDEGEVFGCSVTFRSGKTPECVLPVDGVHSDYLPYPNGDFDYSREALASFRRSVAAELTADERRRYDDRLAGEPTIYAEAFPGRWRTFRTSRLTALVARMKNTVKSVRPAALVSAAVTPNFIESAAHQLQDWRGWLEQDLLDVVCPMAYTTDSVGFAAQIAAARDLAGRHPLWAGIGAYRLTSSQIVDHVGAARRLGVAGVIMFSYDSLTGPTRGTDYLNQVGHAAFNSQ